MQPQLDPASSPQSIEERSFAIIDSEVPEPRPYNGRLWHIARRMAHTVGDVAIVHEAVLHEQAVDAGLQALRRGCTIFTDTEMARCGMVPRRLEPLGVTVRCLLAEPGVADYAAAHGCTRSRAGILALRDQWAGHIVAIGNAPTALLALLEALEQGAPPPALIIGMPVGFVNAAESKALLCQSPWPHLSLRGRKGGSPLVAAVVNALAILEK